MKRFGAKLQRLPASLRAAYAESPRLFWLRVSYLAAMAYILVFWRAIWTPDLLFFMFLGLFFLYGLGRQFLLQFGPFVLLLLAYDGLRSFAPLVNNRVHYTEMIDFDKWLAGGILPTVQLQQWWFHGSVSWYDYYFYLAYMCHFLVPLALAILIWRVRPAHYNRYAASFVLLSYAGFVTYILYPAAPPWMASEMGLIPQIHKVSTDIWWSLGVQDFPSIYRTLSPNLVAAVPSLHAAYATLAAMFVFRVFGRRWGAVSTIYPLTIWVGIIYMGEHYVVDALLGIIYAAGAYALTQRLFDQYGAHARKIRGRVIRSYARRWQAVAATLRR